MRTIVFEGLVRATTQLSHNGGEINGNIQAFRRFNVVQPNGKSVEVPHISGNSVRGKLRDVAAKHMLDMLGDGDAPLRVDPKTFQLLFSGGTLTSGNNADDIAQYREMRDNIVLVALFGGAYGNAILSGKMKINPLLPIARETAHIIPAEFCRLALNDSSKEATQLPSIYTYLQLEMFTKKENVNDVAFEAYIQKTDEKVESSQMIYHVETLAAGTPFYWKVILEDVTAEEFDFFLSVINKFNEMPVVGGKSGTGFGQISLENMTWRDIEKQNDILSIVNNTTESIYTKFVKENKESLKSYLKKI